MSFDIESAGHRFVLALSLVGACALAVLLLSGVL